MEILEPQRFERGVPVEPARLEPVMVRRLKEDLWGPGQNFPERRIEPVVIAGLPEDAPELVLAAKLASYRELRRNRLKAESASRRAQGELVWIGLSRSRRSPEATPREHLLIALFLRKAEQTGLASDGSSHRPTISRRPSGEPAAFLRR
jgi:hypothetical protein